MASPGAVLRTDAQGYLVKAASVARIPARWREPVDSTVAAYAERLGPRPHSVYVRGSVPLGQARDFVSDLDTFAVVAGPEPPADVSWVHELASHVTRRWPFVSGVEVSVYPLDVALWAREVGAMIKLLSVCVYGDDLAPRIAGFRPGVELVLHGWSLPRDAAVARRVLADHRAVDETCVWIAKRIVRSGFELVMRRAGCYTRDLVTCCELFSKEYPERAACMRSALSLAVAAPRDPDRCVEVIDSLGNWLYEEICAEYGAARIEQLLAGGGR